VICEQANVLLWRDSGQRVIGIGATNSFEGSYMRQVYSQVVEWQQLCDTAEDNEYRNGEIHHATTNALASIPIFQWLFQKLMPSSRSSSCTHKMSEKSMAD
jgi:hypothetical protein